MKSDKKIAIMVTAIMVISVFALVMPASATITDWYFKPPYDNYAPSGMPDFDQKQDNWKNPTTGQWSSCGPVAVANCFWWFDSKYANSSGTPGDGWDNFSLVRDYNASGIPNPGPNWDDHNFNNVDDPGTQWPPVGPPPKLPPFVPGQQLQPQPIAPWGELVERLAGCMDTDGARTGTPHSGTNVIDMENCIDKWLNETGLNDMLYEHTIKAPNFTQIEEEIRRSQDVILLLGFWQYQGPNGVPPGGGGFTNLNFDGEWKRIGGHYVTCAGVQSSAVTNLAFSDPFFDNAVVTGLGHIVPNPHPPGYPSTFHNNATNVSHDYYQVVWEDPSAASPGGKWCIPSYANSGADYENLSNFQFQNCPTEFIDDQGELWWGGPAVHTEIEYAVVISPKPSIEVEKTVWNGTAWVKSLDAKINDTLRFNCTIHNSGGVNLAQIRFWDILDCSLNYSGNATLNGGDIVLGGNYVFKPKVLHPDNLSWNPSSPWAESFTELCPDVDHHRGIMDWEDTNNDNRVSACDQIYLLGVGVPASYHVDNVPYTLNVTNMETGEHMYIDSVLDYEDESMNLSAPNGTEWLEVCCCKDRYILVNWTDIVCSPGGFLSKHDIIELRNKRTGEVTEYTVEEVTKDLVVSKEWEIADFFIENCIIELVLEPCQTIIIEFNATVVKCGVDNNTQFAKGRYWYGDYLVDGQLSLNSIAHGYWVYDNDTVTINVPCPTGEATDPTGLTQDVYTTAETVYATGSGFEPNSLVNIYITEDKHWEDGMAINSTVYARKDNVLTDTNGTIFGEEMWPNPIPGEYDMVFDANQNGFYDVGIDAIDDPNDPGFTVLGQVPALTPTGIVALVGLLAIIATSVIVRKRKKR